ncbi:hypothetical protein FRC14_006148 [Serendipita sp. 396]|nr:hypothetical protein FRC14_006148 [Serendipita sp. 396]
MNNGSNEPTTSLPTASHEANHPSTANLTAASTGTTPGTGGSLPGDSRFISTLLIRHSYSIIALLSPQTSTVPTDTPTTGSGISASHSAGEPASTPRVPTSFTNRMDSWIYDPASGRFVPHQLPAGVAPFGPLDTNANPRPAPGPSTTNSVFPDNPSLPVPPDFAHRISQVFRSMMGVHPRTRSDIGASQGSSTSSGVGDGHMNTTAPPVGQPGASNRRAEDTPLESSTDHAQPTADNAPSTTNNPGSSTFTSAPTPDTPDPTSDDMPPPPLLSILDMLRHFSHFARRMSPDSDPPPDTRRAKVLLRGLQVVPKGLVRRLERVEGLLNDREKKISGKKSDEKDHGSMADTNGKLLCLVCYDPLLPEEEKPQDASSDVHEHPDPEENSKIRSEMEVDLDADEDDDDDMDLDVPIDVAPSPLTETNGDKVPDGISQNTNAHTDSTGSTKATLPSTRPQRRTYPYQEPNALVALPCAHVFHATSCLKPWFENGKTTCPTCRFDIDPNSDSLDLESWLGGRRRGRRTQAAAAGNNTGSGQAPISSANVPQAGQAERPNAPSEAEAAEPPHPDFGQAIREVLMSALFQAMNDDVPNPSAPETTTTADNGNGNGESNTQTRSSQSTGAVPVSRLFTEGLRPAQPSTAGPSPMSAEFSRVLRDVRGNRDQDVQDVQDEGEEPQMVIDAIVVGSDFPLPEHFGHHLATGIPSGNNTPASQGNPFLSNPFDFLRPPSSSNSSPSRRANSEPPTTLLPPPSFHLHGDESTSNPSSSTPLFNFGGSQMPTGLRSTVGGSSTSSLTTSSRPSTPSLRHHPYAGMRPSSSTNQNASNTPSSGLSGSGNSGTSATTNSSNPDSTQPQSRRNENFRVTTHTISFSFEIPGVRLQGGTFSLPTDPRSPASASTPDNTTTPATGNQWQPPMNGFPFPPPFMFGPGPAFGAMGPTTGMFGGMGMGLGGAPPEGGRSRRAKKKWVAPDGASLRSVVEAKERTAGLRCDDVSCWFGPEDDDEEDVDNKPPKVRPERVLLTKEPKPGGSTGDAQRELSCVHGFHPECLLVASRIADSRLNEAIDIGEEGALLEAACPFCRTHGVMSVAEWRHCKQLTEQL